ncbi:MAG: alpha/beta hydrolase, partial [Chitinophagaceae bacterium]|nr:alpha/beta hydrolase [Chitinophagaceae bacterium]
IALCMHQQAAGRLLGWGLLHSTAFADSEEKKATRRKAIEFIQEHGAPAFLQTAIPGLFAPAFAEAQPAVVQQLVQRGNAFGADALIDYYEAMIARPDRTAELQRSQVPVLFVLGNLDKAAPYADLLQQVALPDQAHLTVLRDVAHMGMLEQPAAFEAALVQFLQSLV